MERKVKVIQYGCGKMGSICMRHVLDKGGELVGAVVRNPKHVGKDAGMFIEGNPVTGVAITHTDDFEQLLETTKPDMVLVTTLALMKDVYDVLMTCAKHGVNVITSCEEAIYPWNSAPELTKAIDEEAKKNGCTITGSGAQELQWCSSVASLASGMACLDKIVIENVNDAELYGMGFARSYGVGCTEEEFRNVIAEPYGLSDEETAKRIEEGTFIPSFFWNSNEWLARKLNLIVVKQTQTLEPVYAAQDIDSAVLGRVIKKGEICGGVQKVVTETEEGVTIEGSNRATAHAPGVPEACIVTIYDEQFVFKIEEVDAPTPEITCATMVQRIPQIINARAGFVTTDELPECRFLIKSLNEYVE